MSNSTSTNDTDLQRAREKYRLERDKRLRQAGRRDVEIIGDLRKYLSDPFTTPVSRDPISHEVEVAIIGAGFGGLLAASRFKEAGFNHIQMIDRAGDVGGVWYWNRYPEAKCDVESLVYMPLLEETGYIPTERYAPAPEIYAHAQRIARHYDLYEYALFQTSVTELVWDETVESWHVHTDRGDDVLAQFVVICNGPFSEIKLPDIPGIESFQGKSFHTSRWDYSYTGGGPTNSNLDKLKDKTVGFVGTGATGLQCVGPLGHSSRHFYLFQRTPSTVGIRDNRFIDAQEVQGWEPGWQRKRQENFTTIASGFRADVDLVQDGWTKLYRELNASARYTGLSGKELAVEKERVDFEEMEKIRKRIDSIVKDPDTAEKLKPYYAYMCKRAGWHDEYLDTLICLM